MSCWVCLGLLPHDNLCTVIQISCHLKLFFLPTQPNRVIFPSHALPLRKRGRNEWGGGVERVTYRLCVVSAYYWGLCPHYLVLFFSTSPQDNCILAAVFTSVTQWVIFNLFMYTRSMLSNPIYDCGHACNIYSPIALFISSL